VKIPDPPVLTDGRNPPIDTWLVDVSRKLRGNAAQFPTEDIKISYVVGYIQGQARGFVQARLEEDSPKPFTTVQQILDTLKKALGKSKEAKKQEAREEFRRLYQNDRDFPSFWADFIRVTFLLGKTEEDQYDELRERVSVELQEKLVDKHFDDIYGLADYCTTTEPKLRSVKALRMREEKLKTQRDTRKKNHQSGRSLENKGFSKKDSQQNGNRGREGAKENRPSPEEQKMTGEKSKELMPTNRPKPESFPFRCHRCQKIGHIAKHCPETVSALEGQQRVEEVSDESDSESQGKEQL